MSFAPRTAPDGAVEFDADALVDAVAGAVDGCLAGAGARAAEIAGVGASVFWHSLLALDAAGRPLTPLLTWADTRSAAAAAALRARLDARATHARTGAPLHAGFYPARLAWLRASRPDVFARAATWCGFAEYLLARLTGILQASVSMASGTGLLDQETLAWDAPLLAESAIGPDRLPAIADAPARGLAGEWAAALARAGQGALASRLGRRRLLEPGLGLRGARARRAERRHVRRAPPRHDSSDAAVPSGLWRYRIDAARSLVGGATSEGGNVLAWCRERLALPGETGLRGGAGAAGARLARPHRAALPGRGAESGMARRRARGHRRPLAGDGARSTWRPPCSRRWRCASPWSMSVWRRSPPQSTR